MDLRVVRRAVMLACVVLACAVVAADGAITTVSAAPSPSWQTNGRVYAVAMVGSTAYLVGSFTTVRPAGAAAGTHQVVRNHGAAIDVANGSLLAWNPNANAAVRTVVATSTGVYLGGAFSTIGGHSASRLAEVTTGTGARVTGFSASANDLVETLAVHGTSLFVGGRFTAVDGLSRQHLAAISTVSGHLLSGWSAGADSDVHALALTADGSKLIVGGAFNFVAGHTQAGIAALSPATGGWIPWAASYPYPVIALAADTNGVYAGAGGSGGNLSAFDPASGALVWSDGTNGNVQAVTVSGGVVYGGGHFTDYCGSGAGAEICPTSISRSKLFAVDEVAGDLLGWNPHPNSTLGVFALSARNGIVTAGGDFTAVDGHAQQGFAIFR